jgi:hypothetical protein
MTKSSNFPCEGGCVCGAVRYRLLEDPLELHVCHCPNCQTVSGSAFVMCMPVHTRSLELLQGEPKLFAFTSPEGLDKRNRRCAECGACVWGEITPEVVALQAGTLDDTSWLTPIAHIFVSRAQPWVEIPGDVLVYEREPEDDLELVRAWKSRDYA